MIDIVNGHRFRGGLCMGFLQSLIDLIMRLIAMFKGSDNTQPTK